MTSLPTYHATMFEKLSQFDLHHRIAEKQDPALVFFTSTECGACRHIKNNSNTGRVSRRVHTVDVAITLATVAHTRPPSGAAGEVLLEVLGQ